MSPAIDDQSPGGASGSLSTPASDQRRQSSMDDVADVHMNFSDDSGGSELDENGPGSNGPRTKKPRISHACQACRRMKIRCEPLDDRNSCKQCTKTNRECLITAPRRKRQKTVHRVAELEKKIEALTASLGTREGQEEPVDSSLPPAYFPSDPSKVFDIRATLAQEMDAAATSVPMSFRHPNREEAAFVDVIDCGLIEETTAYLAFHRFHTEMCVHLPFVVFPPATTAKEVRSKRPILFLSILAASIGVFLPGMQSELSDELTYILADRIMYRGERSLELVQALLVLMCFYSRPRHQKELNFNQTIHIAATMALDLGMGRRSKKGVFHEKSLFPGVSVVETRRTWLGCYYMCANAAMSLRHPIFIRWSPYMDESIELLSTSPEALSTDVWLCDLIRLQHIAEDVAFMFSMDDPASIVSLADPKTQYHMKTFERQLEQWRKNAKSDISKPWTRHIQETVNLYVHEIAIHFDHNVDDFRPPRFMTDEPQSSDFVTPAHIDSLISCMESIHKAFDAFFEMETETLRNLPNLFFVRNAYAATALIKMDGVLHAKGSRYGALFAPNLKVEPYLHTMIEVQERAAEGGKSNIAMAFGFVFTKLRSWYLAKKDGQGNSGSVTLLSSQQEPSCNELMRDEDPVPDRDPPSISALARSLSMQEQGLVAPRPPTTIFDQQDQNWAAEHLGFSFAQQGEYTAGLNDPAMFNIGLTQFYDFGFTFDDTVLFGTAVDDSSWMGFSV